MVFVTGPSGPNACPRGFRAFAPNCVNLLQRLAVRRVLPQHGHNQSVPPISIALLDFRKCNWIHISRPSHASRATRCFARNAYQVLGVAPTSSLHDIKRAFKRKALRLHPDVNKEVPRMLLGRGERPWTGLCWAFSYHLFATPFIISSSSMAQPDAKERFMECQQAYQQLLSQARRGSRDAGGWQPSAGGFSSWAGNTGGPAFWGSDATESFSLGEFSRGSKKVTAMSCLYMY